MKLGEVRSIPLGCSCLFHGNFGRAYYSLKLVRLDYFTAGDCLFPDGFIRPICVDKLLRSGEAYAIVSRNTLQKHSRTQVTFGRLGGAYLRRRSGA